MDFQSRIKSLFISLFKLKTEKISPQFYKIGFSPRLKMHVFFFLRHVYKSNLNALIEGQILAYLNPFCETRPKLMT